MPDEAREEGVPCDGVPGRALHFVEHREGVVGTPAAALGVRVEEGGAGDAATGEEDTRLDRQGV